MMNVRFWHQGKLWTLVHHSREGDWSLSSGSDSFLLDEKIDGSMNTHFKTRFAAGGCSSELRSLARKAVFGTALNSGSFSQKEKLVYLQHNAAICKLRFIQRAEWDVTVTLGTEREYVGIVHEAGEWMWDPVESEIVKRVFGTLKEMTSRVTTHLIANQVIEE